MNCKDDKIDIQSDDSAASADSGVILNDRLMPSDTNRCNIDISTSIECDNNSLAKNATTINIENIINLAKNVSPTNKGSPKKTTPSNGSSSTASSLRSTRISITSIHSDASSSVIDSDCDVDDCEDSNENYTITKLGHQTSCLPGNGVGIPHIGGGNDGLVLLEQRVDVEQHNMDVLAMASTSTFTCGNPQMAFTNSKDITIGQKNYYQGPVTIQQFLIESRNREGECLAGSDNPGFQNESPNTVTNPPSDHKDFNDKNASKHQPYKFIFNRKAFVVTAIIITLTVVIGGIFATTSFMIKRSSKQEEDDEENRKHVPVNNTIANDNFGGGTILRIVTRDDWLAKPEESESITFLKLPVHRVIVSHTATDVCTSQAACASRTQNIQVFHMDSKGFGDIAYNFLIGGDGAVYEGRGWDKQGAHTLGYNSDSIGIAFIGTYTKLNPTEGQLNALKLIIAEGVRLKKLVKDYRLYGARQFVGTESPGSALFEIIKKWPDWSREPY